MKEYDRAGCELLRKVKDDPFFENWEILELIGHGGTSEVYRARRITDHVTHLSALKLTKITNEEAKHICSEKSLLERIGDIPHLCVPIEYQVLSVASSENENILVSIMPLLNGFRYREISLQLSDIVKLGIQISEALEGLHKQGLIHNDVKLENIVTDNSGNYYLCDFEVFRVGTVFATPAYMAPECFKEKAGPQSDIYALGISLYRLLNSGKLPFENLDVQSATRKRMMGEPLPTPIGCPADLYHIIQKACAYHTKDRYTTAGELRQALEKLNYNDQLVVIADSKEMYTVQVQDDIATQLVATNFSGLSMNSERLKDYINLWNGLNNDEQKQSYPNTGQKVNPGVDADSLESNNSKPIYHNKVISEYGIAMLEWTFTSCITAFIPLLINILIRWVFAPETLCSLEMYANEFLVFSLTLAIITLKELFDADYRSQRDLTSKAIMVLTMMIMIADATLYSTLSLYSTGFANIETMPDYSALFMASILLAFSVFLCGIYTEHRKLR